MKHAGLYLAGISHQCAGAETIGLFGVAKEAASEAEENLLKTAGVSEALVLSTCNRVELYLAADSEQSARNAAEEFSAARGQGAGEFLKIGYLKTNREALEHIFAVASGLLSQMAGETEILGQVKNAYSRACEAGHCAAVLNTAFQKANQCAKWVRTNTDVGHGKISVGSVASELAARIFDGFERAKILLLGTGEAGGSVADALYVRGAANIKVAGRNREKAEALAQKINASACGMRDALESLESFDIVIAASSSPEPLIFARDVESALEKRGAEPMFLIDLGVPHNIDDACADLEDAYLYNLADLAKIADENAAMRRAEIAAAQNAVREKASRVAAKLGFE